MLRLELGAGTNGRREQEMRLYVAVRNPLIRMRVHHGNSFWALRTLTVDTWSVDEMASDARGRTKQSPHGQKLLESGQSETTTTRNEQKHQA